jgi:hypothetical protein
MTEAEYLDRQRFPLSNRQDLSLHDQKMIDAINFDDLQALLECGEELTPAQVAVGRELEEKLGRPLDTRTGLQKLFAGKRSP